MPGDMRVVLYSRRACHLCDEARAVIRAEQERATFRFDEVFVDGVDALEHAYGSRVPVVEIDGDEAFELVVDRGRLQALLLRGRADGG